MVRFDGLRPTVSAIALSRTLAMTLWLPGAEAALAQLG